MGEAASIEALRLVTQLRQEGFVAETDTVGRSLKAQMKYADKIGAAGTTLVLGDNELAAGKAQPETDGRRPAARKWSSAS